MKIKNILALVLAATLVMTGCTAGENQAETAVTPENEAVAESPEEEETSEIREDEVVPTDSISAYKIFLGMYGDNNLKAEVDEKVNLGYYDDDYCHVGDKLSFDELFEIMKNGGNLHGDYDPVPYYTFLTVGDNTLLAIKFQGMDIYSENDDSFAVTILNYIDGNLHITYAFESWARNEVQLSAGGYITSAGSAGAGENIYDAGMLSEAGNYQNIYTDDCVMGDWIMNAFDPTLFDEVYGNAESSPEIKIHCYEFEDETLCTYENDNGEKINSDDQEFLNKLEESGIKLVTENQIEKKIEEKASELSGDDFDYTDECPAVWYSIYDDGFADIMPSSIGSTTKWNYKNDVAYGKVADAKTYKLLEKADAKPLTEMDGMSLASVAEELAASENEEYVLVKTVGSEGLNDYFKLYMGNDGNSVILAPDGGVIKFDFSLCDYIYENVPEMYPFDFDGDGNTELGIIAYLFHGTGFSQKSLIILRGYGEGYWFSQHLTPQEYIQTIGEHLRFIDMGDDIEVIYDTESVCTMSKNGDDSNPELFLDDFVDIEFDGTDIIVRVNPAIYSKNNPVGIVTGTCKITYSLEGYGELKAKNFEYFKDTDS